MNLKAIELHDLCRQTAEVTATRIKATCMDQYVSADTIIEATRCHLAEHARVEKAINTLTEFFSHR